MARERGLGEMFTLLDRETVRLQLPPLPVTGLAESLRIHLHVDVETVDEMLVTVLRAQMLPAPIRS